MIQEALLGGSAVLGVAFALSHAIQRLCQWHDSQLWWEEWRRIHESRPSDPGEDEGWTTSPDRNEW